VVDHVRRHWRLYLPMLAGYGLITLNGHASNSWTPAFLARVHGLEAREVGLSLGVLTLVFGTLGCLTAGRLSDSLARRGLRDAPIVGSILGVLLALIPSVLGPLVPSVTGSLACFAVREFFIVFPFPLAAAAIQLATPNQLRGQMAALYFLTINVVGLGLGPTVVGLMSDNLFPEAGGVRYSLAVVSGLALPLAAVCLFLSRGPYRRAHQEMAARS
jgi:MFS family permease